MFGPESFITRFQYILKVILKTIMKDCFSKLDSVGFTVLYEEHFLVSRSCDISSVYVFRHGIPRMRIYTYMHTCIQSCVNAHVYVCVSFVGVRMHLENLFRAKHNQMKYGGEGS